MSGPAGSLPAIQIHPTRRCNLRCLHCYSDSGPEVSEQLDIEVIRRVLVDAAELGYRVATVSGGEPLTYEKLPELLRAAHDQGMVTTVTTNGMPLDERRIEWLKPDADLVAISLDGLPDSHNTMRGSDHAFETIRAAEHSAGEIYAAFRKQLADLRRTDPLAAKDDLRHFIRDEPKFGTHLSEQFDVAAAAFAESESFA